MDTPTTGVTPHMVAVRNRILGTNAVYVAAPRFEVSHISLPLQEVRRAGIRPLAPGNGAFTGVLASHPEQCNAYEHQAVHIGLNPLSVDSESQYVAADAQHQDQNSLDCTSMGRDVAMQTLLAQAYAEFDLHDVEATVFSGRVALCRIWAHGAQTVCAVCENSVQDVHGAHVRMRSEQC